MLVILLAPALWNGFPFVYADTGGYLARPFEGALELGRSAFYGAFLAAGVPLDFWPNILAQAILTIWVLVLTLRAHGLGDQPRLAVLIVAVLSLLTSLPWFVGYLMPDILLPLAVLALHLLAFRPQALGGIEKALLVVLVAAAIASHMAILGVVLVLVAAFALVRIVAPGLRLARPRPGLPALALATGLVLAPLSNLAITGTFAFTPGGSSFLFARLVQSGVIDRYLTDRCPDPALKLCAFRDDLPETADDWMWAPDSPLQKLGEWDGFEPEARRIIGETLRLYPALHLATALKSAGEQLVTLKTGSGIRSGDNHHALSVFERFTPDLVPRFQASRQQHDWFGFTLVNAVQVPFLLLCMIALPVVLALPRPYIPRSVAALALTVVLALLANAAICGIFSNPANRYQSRLAWLAPLVVGVATLRYRPAPVLQVAAPAPLP